MSPPSQIQHGLVTAHAQHKKGDYRENPSPENRSILGKSLKSHLRSQNSHSLTNYRNTFQTPRSSFDILDTRSKNGFAVKTTLKNCKETTPDFSKVSHCSSILSVNLTTHRLCGIPLILGNSKWC